MKKTLLLALLLIQSSCAAAPRATLVEGDGDEIGTANNPLKVQVAGSSLSASSVNVQTSSFDGNLDSSDDTVQDALNTLDDLVVQLPVLTGVYVGDGATASGVTTSVGIASAISDETGSGSMVFGTSPTFTTQITAPLVYGSSADNGDITIHGTSSATRTTSYVILQPTAGNVGIGTTTPDARLQVSGTLHVTGNATFDADVIFGGSNASTFGDGTAATYPITFNLSGTDHTLTAGSATLTTTADFIVPTEAYDATGWNGDNSVPTKDAVRDKIETLPATAKFLIPFYGNSSNTLTHYYAMGAVSNTTENNVRRFRPPSNIVCKKMCYSVQNAPNPGTWTVSINKNGTADAAIQVVLSGSTTDACDTDATGVSFTANTDDLSVESVAASSPTGTGTSGGFIECEFA